MKILIFILSLNFFCPLTFGQNKLVLMNGIKREFIKSGKILGVTLIGEENKYKDWYNVYNCNDYIRQNLWVIDSIGMNFIYLTNYNFNFNYQNHYDTILRSQIESIKENIVYIDSIIPSQTGSSEFDTLICKTITAKDLGERHKKVNYNDIESFTFAEKNIDIHEDITMSGNININGSGHQKTQGGGHNIHNGREIHVHSCGGHAHYSGGGAHLNLNFHCDNAQVAAIVLLAILPIVATGIVIYHFEVAEARVHTYYLKDWQFLIK